LTRVKKELTKKIKYPIKAAFVYSIPSAVRRILMLGAYLPILLLVLVAIGFGLVSLVASSLIGQKKPSKLKLQPYESGCDPVGTARERYSIKFYMIAVLFILFDIEAVFLYPWAILYKKLGVFGLVEMGLFIVILFVGYIYVWKKGALEWE
jgi:NADH-quinone oxidoreductase subunit A